MVSGVWCLVFAPQQSRGTIMCAREKQSSSGPGLYESNMQAQWMLLCCCSDVVILRLEVAQW